MRLIRQLKKKSTDFFFRELMKKVVRREIRPFHIHQDGLWFETVHGFSVYSNLKDRILELDVNPLWEAMETRLIFKNRRRYSVFYRSGATTTWPSPRTPSCPALISKRISRRREILFSFQRVTISIIDAVT